MKRLTLRLKGSADYERRFSKIDADLVVLKWMVGFILARTTSLVIKTFLA